MVIKLNSGKLSGQKKLLREIKSMLRQIRIQQTEVYNIQQK